MSSSFQLAPVGGTLKGKALKVLRS